MKKAKTSGEETEVNVEALQQTVLDLIAEDNRVGRQSIESRLAVAKALRELRDYYKGGDQGSGGFDGWLKANKISRATAYRYIAFVKRYNEVVGNRKGGATGRRKLAACNSIAECNEVLAKINGGSSRGGTMQPYSAIARAQTALHQLAEAWQGAAPTLTPEQQAETVRLVAQLREEADRLALLVAAYVPPVPLNDVRKATSAHRKVIVRSDEFAADTTPTDPDADQTPVAALA